MNMPPTIPILYGSLRRDRAGIRVVRFLDAALRRRGNKLIVVDAAEKQLPLLDRTYKEYPAGAAAPVLQDLAQLYHRMGQTGRWHQQLELHRAAAERLADENEQRQKTRNTFIYKIRGEASSEP